MQGRFHIRTFGCQMNQHDAEKMSNLLHHAGYRPAQAPREADVVVVHTCSIREKAEHKLYSELGGLLERKQQRPDLVVGVGGCVAQQEGERLLRRFPRLDFVFGPQNLTHLPALVDGARQRHRASRTDYDDDPQARFELPERHPEYASPTPGRAFVTVMEGCDLFCSYCVVPRTRGREVSRSSRTILEEIRELAAGGVVEVTLLGQTVNAYGRPRPGRISGEMPFAGLIERVAEVDGIERIRFTSPHPIFMDEALIRAYAEVPQLCPHLHLPIQSGSTRVLRAMNRRHTREDYLQIVARLRQARSELAITTDIIVGFPGETPRDFEQTLSLVREVGFCDSFSFVYSERPETPAQRRGLRAPPRELALERLQRLQEVQRELTLAAGRRRVGERTLVLVEGAGQRRPGQLRGRCPHNRVVNFESLRPPPAGSLCAVDVTAATPHSLLGRSAEDAPAALPLL
ncbi:MAG: tRNA (N6-isopentenyl adenosine(37)-C2)-methylthiotransferase MiaB [Proteobacteria bacterium]|nr:tRNA (N6-isopentenyl adenosine(37)-C2)-methylthiotransferase MiaB [Pseudomonadota bacterium]